MRAGRLDLAHPFWQGMPAPRAIGKEPRISCFAAPSGHIPGGRIQVTEFFTPTHIGTHIDAPSHFYEDAPTLTDIPLDRFVGPAVIVDVPKGPYEIIKVSEVESIGPKVQAGDILFIKTGWGALFRSETPADYFRFPYLEPAFADWVTEHELKMIGTDTISPDPPAEVRAPGYAMDIHRILLRAGILIAENLNLEHVTTNRYFVVASPIHIWHADGAPARVIGRILDADG